MRNETKEAWGGRRHERGHEGRLGRRFETLWASLVGSLVIERLGSPEAEGEVANLVDMAETEIGVAERSVAIYSVVMSDVSPVAADHGLKRVDGESGGVSYMPMGWCE